VDDFIKAYSKLVSFYATPNPTYVAINQNKFRYFGFYKAMFDFLVKAEPKVSEIIIHPFNDEFNFKKIGVEKKILSPQEAALYKLILECTYNQEVGGLPTSYTKYEKKIQKLYAKIYQNKDAVLPDTMAPIISRIKTKMRKELNELANIEDYIPQLKNGKYIVTAPPEMIRICRNNGYEQSVSFVGYQW
jgi:hypothetical protein